MGNFKITIIGRTNVGKSTLFNRLSGSRDALTFDRPGVTRDTREKEISVFEKKVIIIDTPGLFDYLEFGNKSELPNAILANLDNAIKLSDLIIFVIDGVIGTTASDFEISRILRKSGKQIIVAINKSEKKVAATTYIDAMELGFEDVVQISAEHGLGIDELLESIDKYFPESEIFSEVDNFKDNEIIKLAIVGRPNVGKSAIVNRILGEDKRLVGDFAGLTRESSEMNFEFNGRRMTIIDTPGLRRRSRVFDVLEKISAVNGRNCYKKADVVVLVIDASSLICGQIERQDLNLAASIIDECKPLVIAFNKCDLTTYKLDEVPEFLKRNFRKSLSQLKEVPFLFVSALKNENIGKMLEIALSIYNKQREKIKTSDLNDWLHKINKSDLLQSASARFKLKYLTQVRTSPPAFLMFVTNKESMRNDHERYITNNLKHNFNLTDIPVRIVFKNASTKSS